MAFFLPWLAVGVGLSFTGWGVHQLVTKNDSADEVAKKLMATLPESVAKHVDSIEATKNGVRVKLRKNAPKEIEDELRENLKQLA